MLVLIQLVLYIYLKEEYNITFLSKSLAFSERCCRVARESRVSECVSAKASFIDASRTSARIPLSLSYPDDDKMIS